jgi:hypothetical protein
MRLLAIGLALALAGCVTDAPCRPGTLLVTVDVSGVTADALDITLVVDGAAGRTHRIMSGAGGGSVELDFTNYPAGKSAVVEVTALSGGTPIATGSSAPQVLAASCDAIHVPVSLEKGDLSAVADGGHDLATGDMTIVCKTSSDCPTGQACDPQKKSCSTACSNNISCNGGCCDGTKCVAGTDPMKCGDTGAACSSCPMGQACKAGQCGVDCDANSACNGGCCDGAKCVAGTTDTMCATGGALCMTCANSANGKACVPVGNTTTCGCNGVADCPSGKACNTTTHQCGTACDTNTPCNGGCCSQSQNGQCVAGTSDNACGNNGGVCGGCSNNDNGHRCIGGQCGCNMLADCNNGASSCDVNAHLCVNDCSMAKPCTSGCCSDPVQGTCQPGTMAMVCGAKGTLCSNCASAATNHACTVAQVCGCTVAADCAMGQACSANGMCGSACDANHPCNGECCSNGMCSGGSMPGACGTSGLCTDCTMSGNGHLCIAATCGCGAAADCPIQSACDANKKSCTNSCSLAQPCNGGCCGNGTCQPGTADNACGAGTCTDCTGVNTGHRCVAGVCGCNTAADCPMQMACDTIAKRCTNVCGMNQPCNGGCCGGGTCQPGTDGKACGNAILCTDCTGNAMGTACVAGACGCNVVADCAAQKSCATNTHLCSAACGGGMMTACNGGCCNGGACTPGTTDAACGSTGAACVACAMPQTCGGGGVVGICGCTPKTCAQLNACGPVPDGCGNMLNCANSCKAPNTCGGGGMQNICGCMAGCGPIGFCAGACTTTFTIKNYAAGGGSPRGIAVADFNNDGKLDVISQNGTFFFVQLGNGDGTLGPAMQFPGIQGGDLVVGDWNGDGNMDAAGTTQMGGGIAWSLGNGAGGLGGITPVPGPGNALDGATVADFNGDGKPDIIAADIQRGLVYFANTGNGFAPGVATMAGANCESAAAGDWNGDGFQDAAIGCISDGRVWIFLGRGNGTFMPGVGYTSPTLGPLWVVPGDFNNDGKLDLAATDTQQPPWNVLLGNGTGVFIPGPQQVDTGAQQRACAADFNNDGKLDLAIHIQTGTNYTIALGRGDGTFMPAMPANVPNGSIGVASGDLNKDGRADIVINVPGAVFVLLNNSM